jgi:hypothetical protein
MTADEFRRLALSMPHAIENAHQNHPDFRVRKKIFATLGYPDRKWAMVKLKPEQQNVLLSGEPNVFVPAAGTWGKRGCTLVNLEQVDDQTAMSAIQMAWNNVAT